MTLEEPVVELPEDRMLPWLLWVSLAAIALALLSYLDIAVPWPLAYAVVSAVILVLALNAPRRFRLAATFLVITVLSAWWLSALLELAFEHVPLLRSSRLIQQQGTQVASLLAAVLSIVLVGGVLVAGLFFASEFLLAWRGIFGLSRWEALQLLASLGFGLQYPYMVIENGQQKITRPKGLINKVGGPGLVVIQPGQAVVFERAGKVTQIVGPGHTYTQMFEFPKKIVLLQPRWLTFAADDVLTRDGVPMKVRGGLSARIEPAEVTARRIADAGGPDRYRWASAFREVIGNELAVYQDSVFRAAYLPAGPDWETTVAGAAESLVRDAVGRRRLEDIYGSPEQGLPDNTGRVIEDIEREALEGLQRFAPEWGIEVSGVEIACLEPPQGVQERVLSRWRIAAERQAIEHLGEAEAQTVRAVESARLGAFQALVEELVAAAAAADQGLSSEQAQRFLNALQSLAGQMTRDTTTALRYIEALEKLSQHPGARVVIGPPGQTLYVEEGEK